ncbi:hypothetical protein ABI59_16145 [Acidobacteria bacterium Mor1]|nr:hypothetical protein ABI59_16145 [Acidobacteria bacterium Mor1]
MRRFVARQPILDVRGRVVAYELLYRSGEENYFDASDPDAASAQVMADSVVLHGLDELTDNKRAFINLTRKGLTDGYAHVLPRHKVVCELLESIEPDDEVVSACAKLRSSGYRLALDDFHYNESFDRLLKLVHVVKVDFLDTDEAEMEELCDRLRRTDAQLLAEKIENQEQYEKAIDAGFSLFQGYFFGRPKMVSTQNLAPQRSHYFQLLHKIHEPELDFGSMERILRQEASLCYRLLKYVNSAFFSLRTPVDSIRRALIILGEAEIRKWATFLIMSELGAGRPDELIRHVTLRARFAENLAPAFAIDDRAESLFMLGLFSRLDAMMDRPLEELLQDLPIAEEIKNTLLGGESPLRPVYDYIQAYERADWNIIDAATDALCAEEEEIATLYQEAVEFAGKGEG